eukprot:2008704-Rhodomonas_salina.1
MRSTVAEAVLRLCTGAANASKRQANGTSVSTGHRIGDPSALVLSHRTLGQYRTSRSKRIGAYAVPPAPSASAWSHHTPYTMSVPDTA